MGLMQLLPTVGKGMAKEMKIKHFSPDQLLVADTNLRMGTRYFKHIVDHYDGQVQYALAAYNAGPGAVDKYHGVPPYRETREYVARVIREFNRRKQMAALTAPAK